jgi:signal recognition particle subunit SRP54
MFGTLTDRLSSIFDRLRKKSVLSESDVDQALREIRVALLEADVALSVAKRFIEKIKEKSVGAQILKTLSPTEQLVKIVHDQLLEDLDHKDQGYILSKNFHGKKQLLKEGVSSLRSFPLKEKTKDSFQCLMVVGLQGSGKTTMCSKIAWRLMKEGKKVLMASLDIYRPGAQLQLETLGKTIDIDTLPIAPEENPVEIAQRAFQTIGDSMLNEKKYDVLILDTAGRLEISKDLMEELRQLQNLFNPTDIFFVADVLAGQNMAPVIEKFQETIPLTGCCLSRVDGDSRGGVALSLRTLTQTPLKLLGTGELPNQSELFDPDRFARRILDMGDIVALGEKAAALAEQEDLNQQMERLQKGVFTLNDFKNQLRYIDKLGGLSSILGFLPGFGKVKKLLSEQDHKKSFGQYKAIIDSMTKKERSFPEILNGSRKKRIALGSGTGIQTVNKLLEHFSSIQQMMKSIKKMGMNPGSPPSARGVFPGKNPSPTLRRPKTKRKR